MRKKWFVFLAIICVALAGFVIGVRMRTDKKGPEIIFDDNKITFSDDITNEELLAGVKAEDEVEGDVSDTLTVESVYPVDEKTAIAVYVAKDSNNNITKVKRKMKKKGEPENKEYSKKENNTNKESKEEKAVDPTATPSAIPTAENETAETQPDENTSEPNPSVGPSSPNEEEVARTQQEALAAQMPAQCPRIYLTDYLIRIKQGESIDKLSYVKEIQDDTDNINELWHYIQVDGTLDTNVPETYELTYYVTDSNSNVSNMAVLKVIVE